MAHAIAICSSIEAEKIELKTRKFNASPPTIDPGSKQMRWGFQLGMNSSAWIDQPYSSPMNDVVFTTSMVAQGDLLTGGCIDGWSRKPLGKPHVSKGSASHSATFVSIKGGCYAHIQTPAREHLDSPAMAGKIKEVAQEARERVPAVAANLDDSAK
ncbi:hypothetical protein [Burkholderia sp. BCC1999]|uniref:hypothetical protein n=1 Tax=Burkholderia sp. BCC1999 TaxID=2817448 RepID=UPI002AC3712C|nr:hypothetical protein [Burkholderia sp. BCC1999]